MCKTLPCLSHTTVKFVFLFICRQVQSTISTVGGACVAVGEEVERNFVPLWLSGSLGKLSDWMLLPHVTLAATLGQAEPIYSPGSKALQVGRVETGTPSDWDRTRVRERFLTRRESIGFTTFLDISPLGHKMARQHSAPPNRRCQFGWNLLSTCCGDLWVFPVGLSSHRVYCELSMHYLNTSSLHRTWTVCVIAAAPRCTSPTYT